MAQQTFAEFLRETGEVALDSAGPDAECYRLGIDSWVGFHRIVRMERSAAGEARLVAVWAQPDDAPIRAVLDLEELPWRCLLDLLALARFWSLGPDGRQRGEHDNLVVLEAAVRSHYHRVERVGAVTGWNGDFVGVVHDLMEALGDHAIGQLPAEPQSAPDTSRETC